LSLTGLLELLEELFLLLAGEFGRVHDGGCLITFFFLVVSFATFALAATLTRG